MCLNRWQTKDLPAFLGEKIKGEAERKNRTRGHYETTISFEQKSMAKRGAKENVGAGGPLKPLHSHIP